MKVMAQSHYFMININELNLSILTLLPLAIEGNTTYKELLNGNLNALVNGYSGDINRPWLDDHVILVFDPEKMNTYRVNNLERLKNNTISKSILIENVPLLIHAIKILDEYHKDSILIRSNRFSELRTSIKIRILSFWRQNENSDLYKVLFSRDYSNNSISEEIIPEESFVSQKYVITSGLFSE